MRVFVGVRLDDTARDHLAARCASLESPALRRIRPANYHVTLQFLGSIAPRDVTAIIEAFEKRTRQSLNGAEHLTDAVDRWGAFPSPSRPRVVWAGFVDRDGRLRALAESVRTTLGGIGFVAEERPFRAHVTLGYTRRDAVRSERRHLSSLLRRPFGAPISVRFHSVALIKSEQGPGGSRYTDVAAWPLAAFSLYNGA